MLKSYHHGHHHYLQQFLLFRFVLILLDFVLQSATSRLPFLQITTLIYAGQLQHHQGKANELQFS